MFKATTYFKLTIYFFLFYPFVKEQLTFCVKYIFFVRESVQSSSFPFGGIQPPASLSGKFSHDRFLLLQGVALKNATI